MEVASSGTEGHLWSVPVKPYTSGANMSSVVMAEPSQIELATGSAQGALVPPGTNQNKAVPI